MFMKKILLATAHEFRLPFTFLVSVVHSHLPPVRESMIESAIMPLVMVALAN